MQDAKRESQLSMDTELTSLREELQWSLSKSQRAEGEVSGLREQLTEVRGDLSVLRDSQTGMRDDLELMQNTLSSEIGAKLQLTMKVSLSMVLSAILILTAPWIALTSEC